jgi:hypothetical protein
MPTAPHNTNLTGDAAVMGKLQKRKYLCRRGEAKSLATSRGATISREHFTYLPFVSRLGKQASPLCVYKSATNTLDWMARHVPDKWHMTSSHKGWVDKDILYEHLKKLLETKEVDGGLADTVDGFVQVMILDGAGCHHDNRLSELFSQHNFLLVMLPPHTTHELQPLDVGIYAHFKKTLYRDMQKMYDQWQKGETPNEVQQVVGPRTIMPALISAVDKVFTSRNITSAFEKTGWGPDKKERNEQQAKLLEKVRVCRTQNEPDVDLPRWHYTCLHAHTLTPANTHTRKHAHTRTHAHTHRR